jgi:hypothetical protein
MGTNKKKVLSDMSRSVCFVFYGERMEEFSDCREKSPGMCIRIYA